MTMIDEKEYSRAFKEVLVILNFIPKEDYDKIPNDVILTLQESQDNFYRDYWASEEERKMLISEENNERKQLEYEKRKKYNPDDIFRTHRLKQEISSRENNTIKSLVIKEKENVFQKILYKLKMILKIGKLNY